MPSIENINWNKVTLPKDITKEQILRDYQNACDDLVRLNAEFDKYFRNKKRIAEYQFIHTNLAGMVNIHVHYERNIIQVKGLLSFIAGPDRKLFSDVCFFIFQLIYEQPASNKTLNLFKSLLIIFMIKAGF